jgi:hypothetical protein
MWPLKMLLRYVVVKLHSFFTMFPAVLSGALFTFSAGAQTGAPAPAQPQSAAGQAIQSKGLPPRATPKDYGARAEVGGITIAAEFSGHGVPTAAATYKNENFIVVEVAFFGAADAHTTVSWRDFSLRVNDKKPLPSQPNAAAFDGLMDPEWEPPVPAEKGSKSSLNAGGGGGQDNSPPPPVHPPFALKRTWEQNVKMTDLPEGDRQLPVAGLLFFKYGGKDKGIYSLELVYSGAAGKTTLTLHP